ncbi:hypothetical protein FHS31_001591 [Sphingomonas vulcanisoli]|uniref:ABC-type transport auxiliary lipoprotein component domain-containing protein n=1 Tax=Sphingomonas vulcanisoli TaxID=1658060 RepID=A0ABX0TR28_9SPHN|nr:hypothetical protein [Sphingomonas vulcanisoli]NIJ07981.1 hypothetical protein [Sphingomonas vulcanisoli]
MAWHLVFWRRFGLGISAGLLLAAAPAAAAPADHIYVVERIGDRIAPDTEIGKKRAGLACFPNGRIHWSDIGSTGVTDRRELVQDTLEDAGLPIATLNSGTPLKRQIRLRGVVTEAAADLCAKNMLGHPSTLSGTASLIVDWRGETADGEGALLRHVSTVEHRFEGPSAASLDTIGRVMLEEATRDLALWLQSDARK